MAEKTSFALTVSLKAPLLTKAIESDRYAPFADSLCEAFQESFILAPIASGQTAAYPVRESDRLQTRMMSTSLGSGLAVT